jgi:hypothetical protein
MSFKAEILHPSRWVQDGENAGAQLAHDAWQFGAKTVQAVEANPGKTIAGAAVLGLGVGSLVVFHKPLGAKVIELAGSLTEGAAKAAQNFEKIQEAAGLTEKGVQLKPGENLIRIVSGGRIREYEAHVPAMLDQLLPAGDKGQHPVAMVFDTVLFGGRKGEIPYANLSQAGLPPNGMPGNGFHRICDENGIIGIFPVPQRQGIFSGWGSILKFVNGKQDIQFAKDILADLPGRAPVELSPVHTAGSLPLAKVHLAGMSGGGNLVRTLMSEGVMPQGTVESAFLNATPRFSFQGPVQSGINTMITHGQPKNIERLRELAARGGEGVSKLLLDSFPRQLGRGDTVVPYEGGSGIETKIARIFGKHNSLADSKPYLLFHDVAKANGIDSAAVVPDTSNPFYIRRFAQSADGTKIDETLLAKPFDGHNFAGRPVITADGKVVVSGYRISDLHGPVAPPSAFSAIDHWVEFTGLKKPAMAGQSTAQSLAEAPATIPVADTIGPHVMRF